MHPSELDNPWAPQADLGGFCRANSTLPRLVISNNDCTVKFLDISLEKGGFGTYPKETWHGMGRGHKLEDKRFECVGILKLPVPVNHSELPFLLRPRNIYMHANPFISVDITRWFYVAIMRRFVLNLSASNHSRRLFPNIVFLIASLTLRAARHLISPAFTFLSTPYY